MKHLLSIVFWLAMAGTTVMAQDRSFTQFYATPLDLNPALTGAFDGTYRFSLIYRDQWRQVMESPLASFAAGMDLRFPVGYQSNGTEDALGVGIMFNTDRMSEAGFSTTQLSLFTAYHKALDERNNQFLSIGLGLHLGQRNVSYNNLFFEDQFDGTGGYTQPSFEELPNNNFSYSDIGIGVNYAYTPKRSTSIFAGLALHHVTRPQVSFYYDKDELTEEQISQSELYRKLTAHLSVQVPITSKIRLSPRATAYVQGPHLEVNAGANLRFALGEYGSSAFHIGGWVRPVTNESDGFDLSAAILMMGIELDNFLLGFSYDLSLEDLQTTQLGQSAFEVSIAYLGDYQNETILCPKF